MVILIFLVGQEQDCHFLPPHLFILHRKIIFILKVFMRKNAWIYNIHNGIMSMRSQITFTCFKSTIETAEKDVK